MSFIQRRTLRSPLLEILQYVKPRLRGSCDAVQPPRQFSLGHEMSRCRRTGPLKVADPDLRAPPLSQQRTTFATAPQSLHPLAMFPHCGGETLPHCGRETARAGSLSQHGYRHSILVSPKTTLLLNKSTTLGRGGGVPLLPPSQCRPPPGQGTGLGRDGNNSPCDAMLRAGLEPCGSPGQPRTRTSDRFVFTK